MSKKVFKIIATDGASIRELLFIALNSKGDIYYGPATEENSRTSHHPSGVTIYHHKGKVLTSSSGRPMSEWKGIIQIFASAYSKFSTIPKGYKLYKNTKADGIFLIDVRNYPKGIHLSAYLVKKNYRDDLMKLPPKEEIIQYSIYSNVNPWLVITAY
jgi:hypothetical protein